MALDPRFSAGQMNPGRPLAMGVAAPRQAAPRAPRPQAPTVPSAPIGRPAGAVAKPPTPGPGAPGRAVGWGTALAQKAAPPAGSWKGAIVGASPGFLSPDQKARSAAVAAAPADAAKAASIAHFQTANPSRVTTTPSVPAAPRPGTPAAMTGMGAATPPTPTPATPGPGSGPAATPAPNAPAPAGPAAGPPQAAAPPIATPPTAASQPLKDSPWASERTWGAIGALGDTEVDAALKGAVLGGLQGTEFTPEKLAAAQGQAYDQGMAGLKSQRAGIEADLARRGMSRGGTGAELGQEAEIAARSDIANQQRTNMVEFAKLRTEEKQAAIGQAQQLAQSLASRGVDLENLRMQREQLAMSRRGGGGGGGDDNMIEIDNGDGTTSQVDLRLVDLMLSMGEGGMW